MALFIRISLISINLFFWTNLAKAADLPPIQYFFASEINFNIRPINITDTSAVSSLGSFSDLAQKERCFREMAKVVDNALSQIKTPLLSQWNKQKTLIKKEPLLLTFKVSIYGDQGSRDSFHCNLTVQAREGASGTSSNPYLTYDRKQGKFLPYDNSAFDDCGQSTSVTSHLVMAVLEKSFPDQVFFMTGKTEAEQQKRDRARIIAEKTKCQRNSQTPRQGANATEEEYLEQSRQH